MNFYGIGPSVYDFGLSDRMLIRSLSGTSPYLSATLITDEYEDVGSPLPLPKKPVSHPRHRHDGTSPLPFGMDWSPPPRNWDGRDTVWPHDPSTGWSYCVTVPSWIFLPDSSGSDPVVFYRVEIGVQSSEGVTSMRGILRRFSDFLKLFSELKQAFPKKRLPPAPAKKLLRNKSRAVLEERRCALEDWMQKFLPDIDLSRSAPVAIFLELEAAAISSFYDSNQHTPDANSSAGSIGSPLQLQPNSDISLLASNLSTASDYGGDSTYETSELGTPRHGKDYYFELVKDGALLDGESASQGETILDDIGPTRVEGTHENFCGHQKHLQDGNTSVDRDEVKQSTSDAIICHEAVSKLETHKLGSYLQKLSSSVRASGSSNLTSGNLLDDNSLRVPDGAGASTAKDMLVDSISQFPQDLSVALPLGESGKMNRVLITMQGRLATAKTDVEDVVARLNQELAVRQYLTTKIKDLEEELKIARQSSEESLQQAIIVERERFTQTQWDVEDLRSKCMEMELKLKSEQDEKMRMESSKLSISQENEILLQQLNAARKQIENLQKDNEELELKSKADVKLLVKEVKSLRSSQTELKQELSRLMKDKIEVEGFLLKENERWESSNAANSKLLHECNILHSRLEECGVNFLIEEEDKLVMDGSSTSDAVDLLTTSDNRIGLLLAEAQLLAKDVENPITAVDNGGDTRAKNEKLRKMVTDILIDNARLRKQVNSVIRCALSSHDKSEKDHEEEAPSRKTVLSSFF